MAQIHQWIKKLKSVQYRPAIVLLTGMLTILIGEFSTAFPVAEISRSLNQGTAVVQLINVLPLSIIALMYPLGPVWLQHRSVKELFQDTLRIFMIGSIIVALSPSIMIMIVGRVIQAVGCGMILPMFTILIKTLLPKDDSVQQIKNIGDVISGLAIIMAIILTSCFALIGNGQWVNIGLVTLCLIIYYYTTKLHIDLEVCTYKIEWLNAVLSTGFLLVIIGLAFLTQGLISLSVSLMFLFLGIMMLLTYLVREWKKENSLIDFKSLLNYRYLRVVLFQAIGFASLTAMMVIGSLYLHQRLSYSPGIISLALIPAIIVRVVVNHGTRKLFARLTSFQNVRIATALMMLGWGCMALFSTYLKLLLFIFLTIIIEIGEGLLLQTGENLIQQQKSSRLANMSEIFAIQFRLMFTSLVITILTVVLELVTKSRFKAGLPGELASLAGYRAAFLIFFIIMIFSWTISMFAGRPNRIVKMLKKRWRIYNDSPSVFKKNQDLQQSPNKKV